MKPFKVIFFGSFQHYSVQVLEKLAEHHEISAVVTTPPKPSGRHLKATPTHVHRYAEEKGIPVFALETLVSVPKELPRPDFLIVAGYGKLIPPIWLEFPRVMPINLHPSLLPYYRGAFPAEWAILRGETTTGVTLVKISPEFDKGDILSQKKVPILPNDTRETLYLKLYDRGASLLLDVLPRVAKGEIVPRPQPQGAYFYARKITREDGFVPWQEFCQLLHANPESLMTRLRAFAGWPGVWTTVPTSSGNKRLKLIALKPEVMVQLEGKRPVTYEQFNQAYLTSTTP